MKLHSSIALAIACILPLTNTAQALEAKITANDLLSMCITSDRSLKLGANLFAMGVLDIASSTSVDLKYRVCPKGNRRMEDYLQSACKWLRADKEHMSLPGAAAIQITALMDEPCPE